MRVLILGGGTVGASVAKRLYDKRHEVTVVERDAARAAAVDDDLDVRVLRGEASQAGVLFQAGASSSDVCFALTGNDEVNLVAGSVAKAMGSRRTAARVYAPVFRDLTAFDYRRHFNIDRLLSLEYLTAMELACQIREPGAALVEHFAGGELEMQDVLITKEGSATGKPLADLNLPSEARIAAIARDGKIGIATAGDTIEVGDRVTLIGTRDRVEYLKKLLLTRSAVKRSVVVAGGGETGLNVAEVLEKRDYNVKIIDSHRERCEKLAQILTRSTVLFGDARRKRFLDETRVGSADIFIACAGNDEDNIMACVEARELGAKSLLAVVNQPDYAGVVGKLGIDKVVSPYDVVGRQVEGLTHQGALIFQNSRLLGGNVDVVELEAEEGSAVTRAPLKDLVLPRPTLIAAVIRDQVAVPNASFEFRAGDSVVALTDAKLIPELVAEFEAPK